MGVLVWLDIELDMGSALKLPVSLTEDVEAESVREGGARTTHPDRNAVTSELGYRRPWVMNYNCFYLHTFKTETTAPFFTVRMLQMWSRENYGHASPLPHTKHSTLTCHLPF